MKTHYTFAPLNIGRWVTWGLFALLLAVAGAGDGLNAILAWAYVGFRIAHSLVQIIVNRVRLRFLLHALGTVPLIGLVTHAVATVFR